MLLASTDDIKTFLEVSGTSHDTLIDTLLTGVSARVERYLNRLLEKKERTQYFDAGRYNYYLPAYPIDTSATLTITDESSALTVNSDYYVWEDSGRIQFYIAPTLSVPKQIKIIWTGGYVSYKTLPEDIQLAVVLQTSFLFKRRKDIGLLSVSMPDGSISTNNQTELLPEVVKILKSHRRAPGVS
jgi:hypothetical protein